MLKIALTAGIMMALGTVSAHAETRMRSAAEWEIREHMNERSKAVSKRNGYTYQQGKSVGYRIENGQICLRFSNGQKDCANVETDGKRFQLITRNGDRSDL